MIPMMGVSTPDCAIVNPYDLFAVETPDGPITVARLETTDNTISKFSTISKS